MNMFDNILSDLEKIVTIEEQVLQEIIHKQYDAQDMETLAHLHMEYQEIEQRMDAASELYIFFSKSKESWLHPLVKSELFSILHAATLVQPKLCNVIASALRDAIMTNVRKRFYDSVDLVEAEYKEYLLPAVIFSEVFGDIDHDVTMMIDACVALDPQYDRNRGIHIVRDACAHVIETVERTDAIATALQKNVITMLNADDRAMLLTQIVKRQATQRFVKAKAQEDTMKKIIEMRERQEQETNVEDSSIKR